MWYTEVVRNIQREESNKRRRMFGDSDSEHIGFKRGAHSRTKEVIVRLVICQLQLL